MKRLAIVTVLATTSCAVSHYARSQFIDDHNGCAPEVMTERSDLELYKTPGAEQFFEMTGCNAHELYRCAAPQYTRHGHMIGSPCTSTRYCGGHAPWLAATHDRRACGLGFGHSLRCRRAPARADSEWSCAARSSSPADPGRASVRRPTDAGARPGGPGTRASDRRLGRCLDPPSHPGCTADGLAEPDRGAQDGRSLPRGGHEAGAGIGRSQTSVAFVT
jgi:hypothetical protein